MVSDSTIIRLDGPSAPLVTIENMASSARLMSHGSPNGLMPGFPGASYLNLDSGALWSKLSGQGTTTGWGISSYGGVGISSGALIGFARVTNVAAVRTIPADEITAFIGLTDPDPGEGKVYAFSVASTEADDGVNVIRPTEIDADDSGRYLLFIY